MELQVVKVKERREGDVQFSFPPESVHNSWFEVCSPLENALGCICGRGFDAGDLPRLNTPPTQSAHTCC
jgi:hypothetical protein